MTGGNEKESYLLKPWHIRSSNSRFFPAHSEFEIQDKGGAGFELDVTWENGSKLKVIKESFHLENGALKGRFSHPMGKPGEFQLVMTLCPASFEDKKRRLFGVLLPPPGGRGDEGTGVFVAEAVPIGEPPGEPT